MVDRGFHIEETVYCYRAELAIPSFTKGKNSCIPSMLRQPGKYPQFVSMWNVLLDTYCVYLEFLKELFHLNLSKGGDEWLICTVMALYTEACTVVRTYAGLSESFEMKVGLQQGSVLSPLLFAAVMDVVSSEGRSGLRSKLLYADDLVIMAPTMKQLGRRVADWSASLLGWKQWWEENCKLWKVALWCLWERSTGKLCSVHSMS